jgi:hypothetical protein
MIASVTQCDGGNPALKPPEGKNIFGFRSKEMVVAGDGWILTRRGRESPFPFPFRGRVANLVT